MSMIAIYSLIKRCTLDNVLATATLEPVATVATSNEGYPHEAPTLRPDFCVLPISGMPSGIESPEHDDRPTLVDEHV